MQTATSDFRPICRNVQNNDYYEFLGGNTFRNLRTGKSGDVGEEKAKEVLKINVEATAIINEYPIVRELIQRLNLKHDAMVGD
jgi:hypothetical protein